MKTIKRPRFGVFGGAVALFLGIVVVVIAVFPYAAQLIAGHHVPLPVPRTIQVWWLILLVAALTVYIASNTETSAEFVRPIYAAVRGEAPRWQQRLVRFGAVILPLAFGAWMFVGALPITEPQATTRQQHPGTSGPSAAPYVGLDSPFRHAAREERAAALTTGRGLYFRDCAPCHGAKHDGEGPEARAQTLRPVSFRDPGTIAVLVEDAVFWRVNEGAAGLPPVSTPWDSAMTAWREELTSDEIWQIILSEYDDSGVEPRVTGVQ